MPDTKTKINRQIALEPPPLSQLNLREGTYNGVLSLSGNGFEKENARSSIDFKWFTKDILLLRNIAPSFTCVEKMLHDLYSSDGWQLASCVAENDEQDYVAPNVRNNEVLNIDSTEEESLAMFEMAMLAISNAAAYIYLGGNQYATVGASSGFQALRYFPGSFFKEHIDQVRGHSEFAHRRLTLIAFLQAPEEGGELYFPRDQMTVRPVPNTAVVFPSGITHPHTSLPVKKGTKVAVVTWYM